ncbi:flavodoxin domain-containing protein [Nocardia aurantiaca]|uniref:Flavodoxin n=1 Tax=Nocardia aurantiaca TaxID=2675850 RepID=A0A6I3KW88_9NOCA|nr:flavodoxin domain-containing protein [Nocardia aurantiaca]MTE14272.1 flavodoxin [Nocardia aurantiaca]
MKGRILVAYATRYGATREIADHLATTLRESGLEVDCRAMRELRTIDDYRGIILGAPFYYGRWPRPARRFLNRFGPVLAQRDIALFAIGQIDPSQSESDTRSQLDRLLDRYAWLAPFSVALFGGRWNPAALRGLDRWMLKLPGSPLHVLPASDLRNWDAISGWATDVAAALNARTAQPYPSTAEPTGISRAGATLSTIRNYIADQQLPWRTPRAR